MKIIVNNRRAKFDFDITEQIWAGIVLSGAEVKSIKAGHVSLKGSFASIRGGELFLINTHITPYQYAHVAATSANRDRKLLIHKKEVNRLISLVQSGSHLVPMAIGLGARGLIKVEIGIGRARKQYDKRARIKKREAERDIHSAMQNL